VRLKVKSIGKVAFDVSMTFIVRNCIFTCKL